ncbi:MAG: preprotein translocase YidC [Microbacteriaceae bacterium]|nr:preprotein translocase YidC [Microbacteriaceae bacterium]
MDIFVFPPIAAILNGTYIAVEAFITLITPFAGAFSAAIAIVVLTMLARTLLVPVGRSQVKAEWARRRIQPKLAALQQRYKKNPQLLQEKTAALYKAENVSPFAGILPALAQLPVISLVYALFIRVTIDGHANALLGQHLFGASLGTSFVSALGTGSVASIMVSLVLFALIGVTAWASRRVNLRNALPATSVTAARIASVVSWMPFITVVFAAFVPLAAAVYLTVTTSWTLVERALLRRRYWISGRPDHPEQQDAHRLQRETHRKRDALSPSRSAQRRVAE